MAPARFGRDNWPATYAEVAQAFADPAAGLNIQRSQTVDADHGRIVLLGLELGPAVLPLPAAGWGEKDGTVTNSECRISRQRKFRDAPGEARPDWWIFSSVARRMGFADAFDWDGPGAIFREHAALSGFENHGDRAFNIAAIAPDSSSARTHQTPGFDGDKAGPGRLDFAARTEPCAIAAGSVQKLVGSRGDFDSYIWPADGFKPLTEAGAKRPVVNCAADLQHQVGASPRPAHLLRLVHPTRLTRKFAVPSVTAVPTRMPARCRAA
jgi:anaerobic selenocysteine-containing dehydrogenase